MTSTPIVVSAVQMHAEPRRVDSNLAKAAAFIETAVGRDARLVVLPELFNVGYFVGPELFDLWEEEDGHTVTWMREQARRHGVLLAGTITERRGRGLYNTMFIAEPSGVLHRHGKHTPTLTEKAAFDPGADDPVALTSLGRVGQLICAEAIFAACLRPLVGTVDIVVFSQASFAPPPIGRLMDWWERRSHRSLVPALSRIGAPAVCAGMVGSVQRMTRVFQSYLYGATCITDSDGRLLDRVDFDREGVATALVLPGNVGGDAAVLPDPGAMAGSRRPIRRAAA